MEPERHIEKLLRAFAKRRRTEAGPPSALHPATRRMLQGEVARQYPRKTGDRSARWAGWGSLVPRFALVAVLLAVLGVGAFLLFPPGKDTPATLTLAKRDTSASPPEAIPSSPIPSATMPVPAVSTGAIEQRLPAPQPRVTTVAGASPPASRKVSEKGVTQQTNAPMRAAASRSDAVSLLAARNPQSSPPSAVATREALARMAGASTRQDTRTDEAKATSSLGPSTTAGQPYRKEAEVARFGGTSGSNPPPASSSGQKLARRTRSSAPQEAAKDSYRAGSSSALAESVAATIPDVSGVAVQNFANENVSAASGTGKPAVGDVVLASFQLEQRGRQVRIVDRDGSVYTGTLGSPTPVTTATQAEQSSHFLAAQDKTKTAAATPGVDLILDRGAQESFESLLFSVRGTNATLQQVLVFTGNVQQLPASYHYGLSNQFAGRTGRSQNVSSTREQLQNTRVSGRARLMDGRQLEINAVAVPDAKQQGPK